jgi:hypothetical protein
MCRDGIRRNGVRYAQGSRQVFWGGIVRGCAKLRDADKKQSR